MGRSSSPSPKEHNEFTGCLLETGSSFFVSKTNERVIVLGDKPRIIAARHIRIVRGEVRPRGRTYYWQISPDMEDAALKQGDVVWVNSAGHVLLVLVGDVLSQMPDGEPEPLKQTVAMARVAPDMTWPKKKKKKKPGEPQTQEIPKEQKEQKEPEKLDVDDPRTLSSRLRFAIGYQNTSYLKLSKMMGTNRNYIKRCADGRQIPVLRRIRRMAQLLEVPPEWLAGEPDGPLLFGDKVRQTMTEQGITKGELRNETQIPSPQMLKYITGEELPAIDELFSIAEVLCVSAPWLAGNR